MNELGVRGIISSDDPEFVEFFKFLQDEASKLGKVFFADDAEPRETWVDGMHAEEMFGWLVPSKVADEFECEWLDDNGFNRRKWRDFLVVERWNLSDSGELSVTFKKVEPIDW